jgi:methylthioribose-1-phosphate isomerase
MISRPSSPPDHAARSIWRSADAVAVEIIDQTRLPHEYAVVRLRTLDEAALAIRSMQVRGAPLIGVTAAYGVWLALQTDSGDAALEAAVTLLAAQRPTAVNLRWALECMAHRLRPLAPSARTAAAAALADQLAEADLATNAAIGRHGLSLIATIAARKPAGSVVNILTHCNAGRLACVGWGTATAPIYRAHAEGLAVHVWVDETRPRNQGAALTAWELGRVGVPHTLIADNAGGHLMQQGLVDLVIVGTDRVAANGDVANKIGTYLKALAAHDCGVPFHVAMPTSTFDPTVADGASIPIEQRDAGELLTMTGRTAAGHLATVQIAPPTTPGRNDAFDVTPARLVRSLITEHGIVPATRAALAGLPRPQDI